MTITPTELRRLAYVIQHMDQLAREREELDMQVSKTYGDGVHIVQDSDGVLEITVYGPFVRIETKE